MSCEVSHWGIRSRPISCRRGILTVGRTPVRELSDLPTSRWEGASLGSGSDLSGSSLPVGLNVLNGLPRQKVGQGQGKPF